MGDEAHLQRKDITILLCELIIVDVFLRCDLRDQVDITEEG